MNPAQPVLQSGTYVTCETGSRFRLVSEPAARQPLGTVVFVHAFAEEMNKSRRMAARASRALALAGWRVVQRDLRGCGDSSGEFREASWDDWLQDVDDELSMAMADGPIWLWCQRAGALLATEAARRRPSLNLLLWQPTVSGAQHLQQFLRLHAGARIVGSAKADNGPAPIERLRAGVTVEVGGYELNPALAMGLGNASFEIPADFAGRIVWLEVSADTPPALLPQSERTLQRLADRGITIDAHVVHGPPFWQTQEIADCDALLERTRERMQAHMSPPPEQAVLRADSSAFTASGEMHS